MATFTWNSTTSSTWEDTTAAGWNGSPDFAGGGDSFVVDKVVEIIAVSAGGNTDAADNLTIDNAGGTVIVASDGGNPFYIYDNLVINSGTLNLGSAGQLGLNINGASANAFTIGATGTLINEGAANVSITGFSATNLTGSGFVIANSGLMDFAGGITVDVSDTTQFQINSGATLEFDGDSVVNGGLFSFLTATGELLLRADQLGNGANLSDGVFGGTIAGMAVSTTNSITNSIDIEATKGLKSANLSGTKNDVLTITDADDHTYTFNLIGDYTNAVATFSADGGGFDVFLVCYAAGTAILTSNGEVAVEAIQAGDTVMTLAGGAQVPQTVKWVGHRELELTRHPNRDAIAPVRIMQGALGPNLPHRDLVVSPDHCLFVDGALFPAKLLVNGMTIVRDFDAKSVSYHHIELEQHAVMIAEGVAAESYLDTGNRAFFSNAGLATILHPELNINENLRCWETDACAPLTVKPELVKPVWQRFADRAVALGHAAPVLETTQDAGIHLLVDGKKLRPLAAQGKTISFRVPAEARSVRLVSRSTRPNAVTPWLDDPRNLGIAIRSVTLRDQTGEAVMGADHPALQAGWHAPEYTADGSLWRWTAGDAVLPIQADGPCMVEIAVSATTTYIESANRLAA